MINSDALLILLRITHLQFANIPKRLPYETLLGVAVLCDQYDCRKLVRPWLADWLEDEWYESNRRCQEGWLFIAYYFGRRNIFSQLAMTCVLQANTGDGDDRFFDGGYRTAGIHGNKNGCGTPLGDYCLERNHVRLPPGIVGMAFRSVKITDTY